MSEKAFYFNKASGERVGPWPASGQWPATYAARGFTLEPPGSAPEDEPELFDCLIEGCAAGSFANGAELAAHALEAHGADVLRNLATGELVYEEHVEELELRSMTRPELDAHAREHGIEAPEKLPNKEAVIAAIEALPSPEEEIAQLRELVKGLERRLSETSPQQNGA